MKNFMVVMLAVVLAFLAGCTRIETGTVGVRVGADKVVEMEEIMPGKMPQTVWGSILEFPTKDIAINLDNKTPLTADNSALEDFDVTAIYSVNPAAVAELYSDKSKSFNAITEDNETLIMYNYIATSLNNATYKAVRQYKSLEMADKRQELEAFIKSAVEETMKAEGLDKSITISQIQVRNIKPNQAILDAATRYVESQNSLRVKETEVEIARKENERQSILAATAKQNIEFMDAESRKQIAYAIREGKVNTIIVPNDFKGMINVK